MLKISLKKASFSDIEFLWYLRNQGDVYRYARQNRKVEWTEHINWIMSLILGLAPKKLFIIKNQGLPIGQIRFDELARDEVEVSISVLKEFRGRGLAETAFRQALAGLKKEKKLKTLIATINKKNAASIIFFEKLNFKLKERGKDWLIYRLTL